MGKSTPSARTCRVRISLTDERGLYTVYDLVPSSPPDSVQGYRLFKHGEPVAYQCTLYEDGRVTCSCKGFTHHPQGAPCKHLSALSAIGMLDAEEYLRVRGKELALDKIADQVMAGGQLPPANPTKRRKVKAA